jgi:hypothetical protein
MTDIVTTYKNADFYGRAAFEEMDRLLPATLLAGHEPVLAPANTYAAKASTTLAQFTVVGREGNAKDGAIVIATDTGVQAIGVLAHGFTAGATGVTPASVFEIGCFNIGSDSPLVWDESYDTDAKKAAAFRGAPTPTRIVARHHLAPAS